MEVIIEPVYESEKSGTIDISSRLMDNNEKNREEPALLNERELIEKCRAGYEPAYEEFYRIYSSNVYTLSCKILRDPELANDAVQEVFIKAFRGMKNFQFQSKISTWLYRITVNQCRDILRKQIRHRTLSLDRIMENEEKESRIGQTYDRQPIPREEQINKELRQNVEDAINRLPEEFREVIYLKEIKDMSYEEISKVLGCRLGTVKSRIFRARLLLQNELKDVYRDTLGGNQI